MKTLYKFRDVMDDGDADDIMEILEERGDRVLVRSVVYNTDWTIRPTAVYNRADLVEAQAKDTTYPELAVHIGEDYISLKPTDATATCLDLCTVHTCPSDARELARRWNACLELEANNARLWAVLDKIVNAPLEKDGVRIFNDARQFQAWAKLVAEGVAYDALALVPQPSDTARYTVVGYHDDNGQVFVHHVEAENDIAAVAACVKQRSIIDDVDDLDEMASSIEIVEVFEGHHKGIGTTDSVCRASLLLELHNVQLED